MTLLRTVLRGLRSRALLSAGSVLLIALAVGSAVLGPVFSTAATNSFLVSRLGEAPNASTGLSWTFAEAASTSRPAQRQQDAGTAAEAVSGGAGSRLFAAPQTTLETDRVAAYGGRVMLAARDGECAHLEVTGRCPSRSGEVALLQYDLVLTGTSIGQTIDLGRLGQVTVVGSYGTPGEADADFWFDPSRYTSVPPHETRGGSTPYLPAPWITAPATFDQLPASTWQVAVDRRLVVPADVTVDDLATAVRTAQTLRQPGRQVAAGVLTPASRNALGGVLTEVRAQQTTARASIGPAVFSLVLVALALLLRLLTAAADLRLPELALASLRGLSRRRMWQLGLSEPLVVLALATPLGAVLGVAGAVVLVRAWLVPGLPVPVSATAALTGLLVVLGTMLVAVLAVGQVLRVALADQLTGVRRPRRAGRLAVLAQLTLLAAAVAVLASKLSDASPGDPDVTDLALPVLLAVVAGLIAARGTAAVATWWTRRHRGRSLPSFVAARALSRRQEGTLVILPITAAIAVCVFGAGVYDSAAAWRTSVASTIAPAPVVYLSANTLAETVATTHRIDPQGRYLMAASTLSTQGPSYVVADTTRLARVASWPDQWTPGVSTGRIADDLSLHATVPTVRGSALAITVDVPRTVVTTCTSCAGQPASEPGGSSVTLQLRLGAPDGSTRSVFLGPYDQTTTTASTDVGFCASGDGCSLQGILIGGAAANPTPLAGTFRISGFAVDGHPLAGAVQGAGWTRQPDASAGRAVRSVGSSGGAITVTVDSRGQPVVVQLAAGALPAALPVVAGVDATLTQQKGASVSSSTAFAVRPVTTARSVPLLGPVGVLIDYTTLSTDRTILEQQAPVYVLARSDTPAPMISSLRDSGATLDTTLAQEQRTLGQSAYALALRLYAVVAALVLLMALAGLLVSTAVQLPSRRRDAASLRVVGVPRRAVLSAVLRELTLVLGSTAVAGLAAGTLAQYVVLRTVRLGYVTGITTPALVARIDPGRLLVLAALAAVLLGGVALASAALTVRGARGSTLRETAR